MIGAGVRARVSVRTTLRFGLDVVATSRIRMRVSMRAQSGGYTRSGGCTNRSGGYSRRDMWCARRGGCNSRGVCTCSGGYEYLRIVFG